MSEARRLARETSITIGLASAAIGLITNFFASGITVDLVNNSIEAVSGPSSGSLSDYFTVGQVFFAAAPLVLAVIATVVIIVEFHDEWPPYSMLALLTFMWLGAGYVTASAAGQAVELPTPSGGHPFSLLLTAITWTATPYGPILGLQGITLGFIFAIAFYYFREKRLAEKNHKGDAQGV